MGSIVLASWAFFSLAAAEPAQVVVLVSGRAGVDKTAAQNVAEAVSGALRGQGFAVAASPQAAMTRLALSGVQDPADCQGRADCLAIVGKPFAPAIVVGLHVGKIGKKIALQLSAVMPGATASIADHAFVLKGTTARPQVKDAVAQFAKKLSAYLETHPPTREPEPPPPKDEPRVETPVVEQVSVAPPQPPPAAIVAPPAAPPAAPKAAATWPRWVGVAAGVLAIGAGSFGAYEGLGAMSDGTALKANPGATAAEWDVAGARAQRADIAYASAGVLAVGAVILILVGSSSSPADSGSASGSP